MEHRPYTLSKHLQNNAKFTREETWYATLTIRKRQYQTRFQVRWCINANDYTKWKAKYPIQLNINTKDVLHIPNLILKLYVLGVIFLQGSQHTKRWVVINLFYRKSDHTSDDFLLCWYNVQVVIIILTEMRKIIK